MVGANKVFNIENEVCIKYVEDFSSSKKFIRSFQNDFNFIAAYHATNLNRKEVGMIKSIGLKITTANFLKEKAESRFINKTDSPDLQNKILFEIDNYFKLKNWVTHNEINFGLHKDALINEHYHYLLFGPETLLPLADDLKKKFSISFRKRMVEFGSHYMISSVIPIEYTKPIWINGIYEYLMKGFSEASLVYHRNLPSKNIVKIEKLSKPYDFHHFEDM